MKGSISQIADAVLTEVKSNQLTKLAAHEIVRNAGPAPARTDLGSALQKLAAELRFGALDVTVEDVQNFVTEVDDAL